MKSNVPGRPRFHTWCSRAKVVHVLHAIRKENHDKKERFLVVREWSPSREGLAVAGLAAAAVAGAAHFFSSRSHNSWRRPQQPPHSWKAESCVSQTSRNLSQCTCISTMRLCRSSQRAAASLNEGTEWQLESDATDNSSILRKTANANPSPT